MKAILDNQSLPEINIKGTPKRLLRFRLVSEDRKVFSQWSTIEMIQPADYRIFHVNQSITSGPIKIAFDARTNTISWGPNYFSSTILIKGGSRLQVGAEHNLRLGDEILIKEFPSYAKKRDGVYTIIGPIGMDGNINSNLDYIDIDLNPADIGTDPLNIGDTVNFVTEIPAGQVDVYAKLIVSEPNQKKYDYRHLYRGNVSGSVSIAKTLFPDSIVEPAVDIEIIMQRTTVPKKVYTASIDDGLKKCPVVLAKATLPIRRRYARMPPQQ